MEYIQNSEQAKNSMARSSSRPLFIILGNTEYFLGLVYLVEFPFQRVLLFSEAFIEMAGGFLQYHEPDGKSAFIFIFLIPTLLLP